MPDVLQMIAQNPEMAQSLDQGNQAQPAGATVAPMTSEQAGNYSDVMSRLPAVVRARSARTANILSSPDLRESIETHHQAVADATALHHQASQELSYLHAAHTLHDTGAYYQGAHAISASDPDYESKMLDLAQQHPFAKPDANLMQPLHEARRTFLTANSAIEQRKADDDIQKAMDKGHLTVNDLANPAYRNPQGGLNYQALKFLAGSRSATTGEPNEYEREILKAYPPGSTAYNKLFQQTQKGDQAAIGLHNALWTARKKADPGLAQRLGDQTGAAPAAGGGTAPNIKSMINNF